MVFTHVIHVITWITTHLPIREGWKAELVSLADSLPTKWSLVNHRLGAGQRKSAGQRLTSEPLSHAANTCGSSARRYMGEEGLWRPSVSGRRFPTVGTLSQNVTSAPSPTGLQETPRGPSLQSFLLLTSVVPAHRLPSFRTL